MGDLQEDHVIVVGGRSMGPRRGGDVLLELQDGQERLPPRWFDSQPGPPQHLAVLELDPVVEAESQPPPQKQVNESSRWPQRRQQT